MFLLLGPWCRGQTAAVDTDEVRCRLCRRTVEVTERHVERDPAVVRAVFTV